MSCGCTSCRLNAAAFEAIDAGVTPADPAVRAEVVAIWEGRAENAEAESRTCLGFAAADDRFAVTLGDDSFAVRAAMFRGMSFRARERATDMRAIAEAAAS